MIKSPYSGSDFRNALLSKLSPGEQLQSFADCLIPMIWIDGDGNQSIQGVQWYFLALTNINIRQGGWTFNEHSAGFFKPSTWTVDPEIISMTSYAISDVVTTSHSKMRVDSTVSNWISNVVGVANWPRVGFFTETEECFFLTMTLSNSTVIDVLSPFVEFGELIENIDAAKSGALIVTNTAAAADALDQLIPLLKDGILTQEEFDRAKDGFLGATVEVRESSVGLLRQLHSLHKSGVLTESEFNLKKWNILSKDE